MDIYRPSLCPICEVKMENLPGGHVYFLKCKSNCYSVRKEKDKGDEIYSITIFDAKIRIRKYMEYRHMKIQEKSICDRIKYWKKDYRYLAELLDRM